MKKKPAVHPAIKEQLGYDPSMSDKEFLVDWKKRSTHVCKPCWELKYCPYGPFVEQSPLLPPLRSESLEHHHYLVSCLETGWIGQSGPLSDSTRESFEYLLALYEEDPTAFAMYVVKRRARDEASNEIASEGRSISDILGGYLPSIQKYRAPFPFEEETGDMEVEVPPEIRQVTDEEIRKIREALISGVFDSRQPLDAVRRSWIEDEVASFNLEDYPEEIPQVVLDISCNIFGHICPIVFVGENVSETSDERRRGRYIPFSVKMRVVRRDNYTCQECGKHLRDDEVEFDHVIPVAKGGSSEEHNIRLTCYDCNRDKSDSVKL